jgi:WD40 repeat protein/class 3 adenylate cyclase
MATVESLDFGTLLRRYRKATGLTQEELAEQAGLSARSISDLERGLKYRPHRDTVQLLADALQLSGQERSEFEAAGRRLGPSESTESGTGPTGTTTSPAELATGLRTFLIADVRGYTRFTNERGDEAAARLAERFATLAREGVAARGGEVVELRGDEALAVFGSARNALHAALDLQARFAEATDADSMLPLPVGIGLDAGEAVPVEDGYRGGALNLAARLCSLAGPGEVLASAGVVHLARRTEGVAYVERGEVELKGLEDRVRVILVLPEGALSLTTTLPPLVAATSTAPPAAPFVFVCYAHADHTFAARLVADLQVGGITCWTDQLGLKPGTADWEQSVRDAIRACQAVLLVASRDSRQSRYVKAELSVAEMYQRLVYPLWAAGEDWIDCISMSLCAVQYVDARGERYATALAELAADLDGTETADAATIAPAKEEPTFEPRNPYKGLRAFTEDDAGDFFGRTGVIDNLVQALEEALGPGQNGAARLLTVVGPSGSGKSSVVMAGLLPRLRSCALPQSDAWVYLEPIVPGNHPVEALTVALAGKIDRSMHTIRDDLDDDSSRGLHMLASHLTKRRDARVVLLIDQFEELFTQATDETERQQFVDLLVAAVTEPRGPVLAVLTVRADFYHQTMRYPDLWRLVETHTRSIAPMSVEELREVIEEPARLPDTRLSFEGDLDGDLLFELRGQEGCLPLLQFTLDQLFERREGHCLTMAAYRELGGVQGALAGHAEATYMRLPSAEHRAQARALFLRLIEPGASEQDMTRRRLDMTELVLPDQRQTAILHEAAAAFVDARLLISNEVGGACTLEVGHEALIRSWPRLYRWVQEDRGGLLVHRRLTEAALEWQRERDESLLYRGTRLAALHDWLQRTDTTALNEAEQAFVEASVALKEREEQAEEERQQRELAAAQELAQSERRRARVARSLSGGLALVLVGALVIAYFAVQQSHQAQTERNAVISQQNITKSHDLAASALAQVRINPELSVLLAVEAAHLAPTDQAETTLRQALSASPVRAVMRGHSQNVTKAAFSPDGTLVVTASQDNTARVWDARTGKLLWVLRGHGNFVNSAAFSPDGALIVTASDDQSARVWDARAGRLVTTLNGHTAGVNSATFSPDSTLVVTTSRDNTARVWEARTGQLIATLQGHTYPVVGAAFSPDGRFIVTASSDHSARVWATHTGRRVWLLRGHTDNVNSAEFSPDGALIVTAGSDRTARLWNAHTGKQVTVLSGHASAVNSAAFSPDGTLIITASDDKTAQVWDGHTGKHIASLAGHTATVHSAVFSPDSTLVVTASDDKTARVWLARAGRLMTTLGGHADAVNSAAFNPSGTLVVTASNDRTARVWQTFTSQLLTILTGHRATVNSAAFSPDGRLVVTASGDHTARVWTSTGRTVTILSGHRDVVNSAAFSPHGDLIVTAGQDETARVWNARSGTPVAVLQGHTAPIYSAAFSPDGAQVVTAGQDRTARVWNAHTGHRVATMHGHTAEVNSAAFSPDGTLVITASWDDTARIWQAHTGHLIHTLRGHSGPVLGAGFSPDGAFVVTASGDHTAQLWDAHTGKRVSILRGHGDAVNSAVFSPDGALVVTASQDKTARVWDAHTGAPVATVRHGDAVISAAFSPDSALVVTASQDKTARVWQARTGKLVMVLGRHTDAVNTAAFSSDGKLIVTAGTDGTAHVYSCDVCGSLSDLLALVPARITRHLTPQERAAYL